MRAAAERVLAAIPTDARKCCEPSTTATAFDWHYTPRSRNGVSLKDLDAGGREAVHALLKQALSAAGHAKVVNIIELELVLREIETFGLMRDPERYHLTIYGTPDRTRRWGWRFEGHHVSLNFTLAGDRPRWIRRAFSAPTRRRCRRGRRKALRVLAEEEDEARKLLASFNPAQRGAAVFESQTYGEIVTGNAERVDPLKPAGIVAAQLDEGQRAQLVRLIEIYARNFEPGLAAARLARVREGGIEKIPFGWAGATERGRQHYYRIQGPLFLIEYDCSQNDGNHIHTVWRDFSGDFGRDLLREHYQADERQGRRAPPVEPYLRLSSRRLILEVCEVPVWESSAPRATGFTATRTPSTSLKRRSRSLFTAAHAAGEVGHFDHHRHLVGPASPTRSTTQKNSPLVRASSATATPTASGNTLTPRSFTMLSLRPKMRSRRRRVLPQAQPAGISAEMSLTLKRICGAPYRYSVVM